MNDSDDNRTTSKAKSIIRKQIVKHKIYLEPVEEIDVATLVQVLENYEERIQRLEEELSRAAKK